MATSGDTLSRVGTSRRLPEILVGGWLCVGMPLITIQYAPDFKRRETLKSVTHRAYGPYMPCVFTLVESSVI